MRIERFLFFDYILNPNRIDGCGMNEFSHVGGKFDHANTSQNTPTL